MGASGEQKTTEAVCVASAKLWAAPCALVSVGGGEEVVY